MLPNQLQPDLFGRYPPEARQIAVKQIALLRQLPVGFVPLLLRELIIYDWKFPAERKELDRQFAYLSSLSSAQLKQAMTDFERLRLSHTLDETDWVNQPAEFSQQLSAYLWSSGQIDEFRKAATDYMQKVDAAVPPQSTSVGRLAIAIFGEGVTENSYPLFRKLRPHGVYFSRVQPVNGTQILMDAVAARAKTHPTAYAHWYVDGGMQRAMAPGVTCVSYESLDPIRVALLARIQRAVDSGTGPEALRTMLAAMRPEDLGLNGTAEEGVLNRFKISLLTEGSGTQLYSTTFVQWTAREALRRAQPLTILTRYAPRQRERTLSEMVQTKRQNPALDPEGSLIDADMGAYYTWINQVRLPGAARSAFLAWFENHSEALAVSPTLPRGTTSNQPIGMSQLLANLT